MCKNVVIFGVDRSPSVYIDNRKKDILTLSFGPTQWLDDTTLTAEAQYSINFSRSIRKFCLNLHKYPLCSGNISGEFSANNLKKKTGLNGCVYDFSVDYRAFDTSSIIDIHKYLIKKLNIK